MRVLLLLLNQLVYPGLLTGTLWLTCRHAPDISSSPQPLWTDLHILEKGSSQPHVLPHSLWDTQDGNHHAQRGGDRHGVINSFAIHLQNLWVSNHCGVSYWPSYPQPQPHHAGHQEPLFPRSILGPFIWLTGTDRLVVMAGRSEPHAFLHWRNHFYSFSKIQFKSGRICLFILFLYILAKLESVGIWLQLCVRCVPSCGYSPKSDWIIIGL